MVAAEPNRPDPKDEDRSFQFHMREYSSLRGQAQNHIDAMRVLERYAVGSVAALYSWILINHHAVGGEHVPGLHPSSFLWFLPLAIVVLGWLRSIAMARRIKIVGEYCRQLETRYGEPDLGGWENILELRKPRSAWLSREVLWRVLLVASLAVSTWGFILHELADHCTDSPSEGAQVVPSRTSPDFVDTIKKSG